MAATTILRRGSSSPAAAWASARCRAVVLSLSASSIAFLASYSSSSSLLISASSCLAAQLAKVRLPALTACTDAIAEVLQVAGTLAVIALMQKLVVCRVQLGVRNHQQVPQPDSAARTSSPRLNRHAKFPLRSENRCGSPGTCAEARGWWGGLVVRVATGPRSGLGARLTFRLRFRFRHRSVPSGLSRADRV
jgi:hypothetical protein